MSGEINVQELAFAYRRLVLWFGAQLILGLLQLGLQPTAARGGAGAVMLSLLIFVAAIVILCALAYYGYKTASALGSTVAWLWGIAMFVPCVNLLTLLTLSSKATRMCRANGIPVGFLGPKIDS